MFILLLLLKFTVNEKNTLLKVKAIKKTIILLKITAIKKTIILLKVTAIKKIIPVKTESFHQQKISCQQI